MSISADNGGLSADWSPSIQWSPTECRASSNTALVWQYYNTLEWCTEAQYKRAYKTHNSSPRGDPLIDRRPYRHNTTHTALTYLSIHLHTATLITPTPILLYGHFASLLFYPVTNCQILAPYPLISDGKLYFQLYLISFQSQVQQTILKICSMAICDFWPLCPNSYKKN